MRHMTVRADGAHTGAIAVVDRFLVFRIDVVAHLVAGDAELQPVACFHAGIESAPENDAEKKEQRGDAEKGILHARLSQSAPATLESARGGGAGGFFTHARGSLDVSEARN